MTAQGVRMTGSRRAILSELRLNGSHPTADELHERLRERFPRISLGTVYRNLEYLSGHGLVRALREPGGRRRYDAAQDEHYHVWCTSCGEVQDVRLVPTACVEGLVEDDQGYRIDGHSLSFLGTCPECDGRRDSRNEQGR
ncbi:MAG: transcriptional repressor [Candidatus Eisenbacteria bacterium]